MMKKLDGSLTKVPGVGVLPDAVTGNPGGSQNQEFSYLT